ncbi:MAG TPA: DUF2017 family protein [Candidatus Limnocylindrales bacterium]|nr:DUF2017 family protein [Candidatus Limnocylindrales bacterium]
MREPSLPVSRTGRDQLELRLEAHERRILGSLVAELRGELDDPAGVVSGGVLSRLYPPAFPDDPVASADYADLVHADLAQIRRDRVAVVEATIDAASLDEAQAGAWLGVLNDARLVLGTSLGLRDEAPGELPDDDDPEAMRYAVFAYLGWLVGAFTDALAEGLPEIRDAADPT